MFYFGKIHFKYRIVSIKQKMKTIPADYMINRIFILRWLYGENVAAEMSEKCKHMDARQHHKTYQEDMKHAHDMHEIEENEMRMIFINNSESKLEFSLNRLSIQEAQEVCSHPELISVQDDEMQCVFGEDDCATMEYVCPMISDDMQRVLEEENAATLVYVCPMMSDEMQKEDAATLVYVCPMMPDEMQTEDAATLVNVCPTMSDEMNFFLQEEDADTVVYVSPVIFPSYMGIASKVETNKELYELNADINSFQDTFLDV